MPHPPSNLREFASLVEIIKSLRGPEGCPWDKAQTHQSLARYTIEEAAELAQALDREKPREICEELGDLLLQIVLHAEIARQEKNFDIHDVINAISEKMVRRHPHVFATQKVDSASEVQANWQQIKAKEKTVAPLSFDLPTSLPALIAAHKIGEKTKAHRFDWNEAAPVLEKVHEEIAELTEAMKNNNRTEIMAEMGDVLFSLAQLGRHLQIDSEQALRIANARFEKRFTTMLRLIAEDKKDPQQLSAIEMESFWQKAKQLSI